MVVRASRVRRAHRWRCRAWDQRIARRPWQVAACRAGAVRARRAAVRRARGHGSGATRPVADRAGSAAGW